MQKMSGAARREQVLAIAAEEFARNGLHGVSVESIARQANITQPYVFRIFGTKQALFLEVMFQASEADFQNTMLALQTGNDDAAQTLCNFGQRFLGLLYSPEVMAVRRLHCKAPCNTCWTCATVFCRR